MSNTSSTGGFLVPGSTQPLPGGLTLAQFIQTVLVGISGIAGDLIRPKFQVKPPKQPDINVNWIAFQVLVNQADTNAYTWPDSADEDANSVFQRQERLEIMCSFYGPAAQDYASLVRDGFQIQQNLEALRAADMGFEQAMTVTRVPDLVNERWIDRFEMSVFLLRQIQRTYPVLAVTGAEGTIYSRTSDEDYSQDWQTPEPPVS